MRIFKLTSFSTLLLLLSFNVSAQLLDWAANYGHDNYFNLTDMEIDGDGNLYWMATTSDTLDLDPDPTQEAMLYSSGGADSKTFIAKYDSDGNYITRFDLSNGMLDLELAVTPSGKMYIVTVIEDTVDFDLDPVTEYLLIPDPNAYKDIAVALYDTDGSLEWAFFISDGTGASLRLAEVDPFDNIVIVGENNAPLDLDPSAGTFTVNSDHFMAKYDDTGAFVKGWELGAGGSFNALGLSFGSNGSIILSGNCTGSPDFDPGAGSGIPNTDGSFIAKYKPNGKFKFVRAWGNQAYAHAAFQTIVMSDGTILVPGYFDGTVDFHPGAPVQNYTSVGGLDAYLVAYSSSGAFLNVITYGTAGTDFGVEVAVDTADNILFGGYFSNTLDFDQSAGVFNLTSQGFLDVFVCHYESNGAFIDAMSIGGTDYEYLTDLEAHGYKECYLGGTLHSTADFDPGAGTHNLSPNNYGRDVFLAKYLPENPPPAMQVQPTIHTELVGRSTDPESISLQVYPNPVVEDIFLQFNPSDDVEFGIARLLNVHGRVVLEQKVQAGENQISVSNLPDGIYFIQLSAGAEQITQTIMITR